MENVIALNDFLGELRRKKAHFLKISLFSASLITLYMLTRPVIFEAEATFREKKPISEVSETQMALKWLSLGEDANSSEAISWFKSRSAREALVKKFDLNGEIKGVRWFSFPTLLAIKEHFITDFARLKKSQSPSLPRHLELIEVKNIVFNEEAPLVLTIYPDQKEGYSVYHKKKLIGKGRFSEVFSQESYQFILKKRDQPLLKKYTLTLYPIETRADDFKGMISVKSLSKDPTLLFLTLSQKDRFLARDYLNGLMELYRDHLKTTHRKVLRAQLDYLETHQEEMSQLLDQTVLDHFLGAKEGLAHSGFISSEKAFSFLADGVKKQKERVSQIDFEIKRLKEKGGFLLFEQEKIAPLLGELRSLNQMKHSLQLTLGERSQQPILREYRGLTLQSSQEFYLNLCRDLKELKGREELFLHVLEELKQDNFAVTSLSSILKDSVSQKLIDRAIVIKQLLTDESNRTNLELIRLQKEMLQTKEFLKNHLEQTLSLIDLEEKEVLKKIEDIQQVSYVLSKERIALLEKELKERIDEHILQLEQEKRLLLNETRDLNRDLERVPSQWLLEKKLERQLAATEKITADLNRLVQNKNMATQLEVVTAEPQDFARAPLHAKPVHLILVPLFGAFLGGGFGLASLFLRGYLGHLPIGKETLLLRGMKVIEKEALFFETFNKSTCFLLNGQTIEGLEGFVELSKEQCHALEPIEKGVSNALLSSLEAQTFAKKFEHVVIFLQNETTKDLIPYFLMGKCFTFIFSTKGDNLC